MEKLIYTLIAMLTIINCSVFSQTKQMLTEDEAYKILEKKVSWSGDLYKYSTIIDKNTKITPMFHQKVAISPDFVSYAYFIDDNPYAGWTHPCRYIFIDVYNGDLIIENSETLPLDIKDFWKKITAGSGDALQNKKKNEINQLNSIKSTNVNNNLWAVIISGGNNSFTNYSRYYHNCQLVLAQLKSQGYPSEHIFILMSDGLNVAEDIHSHDEYNNDIYINSDPDLDGDGFNDIGSEATKTKIQLLFSYLGLHLTGADELFVYITGHGEIRDPFAEGNESPGNYQIDLWGDPLGWNQPNPDSYMTEVEFQTELQKVDQAKSINIVMNNCHSGGFLYTISGVNSTMTTACEAYDVAYAHDNDAFSWDEFTFNWVNALRENTSGIVVDANQDSYIDMQEAWAYARDNDKTVEYPQYNSYLPYSLGVILTLGGVVDFTELWTIGGSGSGYCYWFNGFSINNKYSGLIEICPNEPINVQIIGNAHCSTGSGCSGTAYFSIREISSDFSQFGQEYSWSGSPYDAPIQFELWNKALQLGLTLEFGKYYQVKTAIYGSECGWMEISKIINILSGDLYYTGNVDGLDSQDKIIKADHDLITQGNVTITLGRKVTFQANNSIKLMPGFHATNYSAFHAIIRDDVCSSAHAANGKYISDNNLQNNIIKAEKKIRKIENLTSLITEIKNYDNSFIITPNPSNGKFTIDGNMDILNYSIEVKNIMGRKIYQSKFNQEKSVVDISNSPQGVYIVTIDMDGKQVSRKAIVQ